MRRLSIAGLLVMAVLTAALAQMGLEAFTADITIRSHGKVVSTSHESIDHGKIRNDMNQGGHRVSNIIRPDKHVTYMVMHDQKMYMVMPMGQGGGPGTTQHAPQGSSWTSSDTQLTKVGTEVVDGLKCDKYSVSHHGKVEGYLWRSSAQALPVRYMSADGATQIDYTNVKLGPVDPSVFDPPAGYRVMQMPGMPPGH
ncbi:MAG: DUF4412 domain-containing protein [Candidatus Xenobia bacterium]